MAGASEYRLWLLSDGAPGHWSQTQGVADALDPASVQRVRIDLQVVSPFWKRLGRLCLPWIRDPAFWLQRVYALTLPAGRPDLVISSGANTLLANALLARLHQAPNAYSGTLKGYAAAAYQVVFTVRPLGVPNNVVLPLPPVPGSMTCLPDRPQGAAELAVLIGGDGAGVRFTSADWTALADGLNRLAASQGARLLVTTSRRTGAAGEAILKQTLQPAHLAEAVWWSESPRPVVREFLARATAVVVTGESLTMVAEAIYSARPVVAVLPEGSRLAEANDEQALAGYAAAGLVTRCVASAAVIGSLAGLQGRRDVPDVPALIRQAVLPLLAASRPS